MSESWLIEARVMPILFAQVREDPLLDLEVINNFAKSINVLMIGSGGCTLAALTTQKKISKITVVDANQHQIGLCKFKQHLLSFYSPEQRLKILGHSPMSVVERRQVILKIFKTLGLPADIFGPLEIVVKLGPDYVGRYELLFKALAVALRHALPNLEQSIFLNKQIDTTMQNKIFTIYQDVLCLDNLIMLFGEEATQNSVKPFYQHFYQQTIAALESSTLQACHNPFLHQMLFGKFLSSAVYPWLALPVQKTTVSIKYQSDFMFDALHKSKESYDFIHLSNICDWLDKYQAQQLLQTAYQKLNKNGRVFIRQLNSNLNLHQINQDLNWDKTYAQELLKKDRSFFYPKLHIGIKK